jgi:2-methylcitrate dehydratase
MELRAQISSDQIKALRIDTYGSAHKGAVADPELWAPKTRETADHSMLFSIVCALIDGEITPQTFDNERFLDSDILDLIGRTTVEIDADFSSQTPQVRKCRLTAENDAGESFTAQIGWTSDDIERGPDDETVEKKFRNLAGTFLPPAEVESLLDMMWHLDGVDDIRQLVDRLRI